MAKGAGMCAGAAPMLCLRQAGCAKGNIRSADLVRPTRVTLRSSRALALGLTIPFAVLDQVGMRVVDTSVRWPARIPDTSWQLYAISRPL
jgi:hypothetical protein